MDKLKILVKKSTYSLELLLNVDVNFTKIDIKNHKDMLMSLIHFNYYVKYYISLLNKQLYDKLIQPNVVLSPNDQLYINFGIYVERIKSLRFSEGYNIMIKYFVESELTTNGIIIDQTNYATLYTLYDNMVAKEWDYL